MSHSPQELACALDDVIWSREVDQATAEPGLRVFFHALSVPPRDVLSELSDESLAQAYRRGLFRHQAFEALFVTRYERVLRGWFYKRTLDRDRMQELLQEFYVKLLTTNALASYNPDYSFRPWFWRVVQNFWISDLRRRARETGAAPEVLALEPAHEAGPFEEVLAQELQERLDEAVASLPEDERQIVTRTSSGQAMSRIAQEMGLPIRRTYQLHFRARRAIERRLNLTDGRSNHE